MKLLLHACCGPCSVYPVDALRAEGIEPRLFFKNPNVHPYLEFTKRIEAFRLFCEKRNVDFIVDDEYDIEGWLRTMVFREAQRCRLCYRMRLTAAARVARRGKFDAFSSTLLYSKRQNHELVRETAEAVAEEQGISFLYRDFRAGWKAGIEQSRQMGLYRQSWCGCVYSERDRFAGVPGRRDN